MPGLPGRASAAAETGKGEVFKLREVSVFEQGTDNFLRGQTGLCQDKPFAEVKRYPACVSKKPVYGSVRFAADYGQTNGGMLFYFAMDESQGTGKGYDRLYFDLNRDLDLRNDPVVMPQRHPPDRASLRYSSIKQQVIFDLLTINFDFGPAGTRPVQIMPRLTVSVYDKEEYKQVTLRPHPALRRETSSWAASPTRRGWGTITSSAGASICPAPPWCSPPRTVTTSLTTGWAVTG